MVASFESIGRGVLPAGVIMCVMAGGGICMALYILHAQRIEYPIIDMGLMKLPTFAAATLGGGLFRMGIGALPFLLAMLLQLVFGLTPFASGLLTFASAAGAMLMKVTAPPIIRRLGFRSVLIGNGVLSAFIMMSYALFRATTAHFVIVLALLTGGFFRSLQFTALGSLAYADISSSSMSSANTLASMAQQLFLSLGVAIGAMLLHISLGGRGPDQLSVYDFTPAFVVMGVLALMSSVLFIPLDYNAGEEVSGRRPGVELARTVQTIPEAD